MNKKEERIILKLIIWLMVCFGCLYTGYQLSEANIYKIISKEKNEIVMDKRKLNRHYYFYTYNNNKI